MKPFDLLDDFERFESAVRLVLPTAKAQIDRGAQMVRVVAEGRSVVAQFDGALVTVVDFGAGSTADQGAIMDGPDRAAIAAICFLKQRAAGDWPLTVFPIELVGDDEQ